MYARPPSHAEALGPGSAGPSLALPYANPLDQVSTVSPILCYALRCCLPFHLLFHAKATNIVLLNPSRDSPFGCRCEPLCLFPLLTLRDSSTEGQIGFPVPRKSIGSHPLIRMFLVACKGPASYRYVGHKHKSLLMAVPFSVSTQPALGLTNPTHSEL